MDRNEILEWNRRYNRATAQDVPPDEEKDRGDRILKVLAVSLNMAITGLALAYWWTRRR